MRALSSLALILALAPLGPAVFPAPPSSSPAPISDSKKLSAAAERQIADLKTALTQNDLERATATADKLVQTAPEQSAAWLWAGRAYGMKAQEASVFTKMSWAKKCREAFQKAVDLDSRSIEARFELFHYFLLAPGFAGGGIEKAQAQADELAKIDPLQGRIARAQIAFQQKNTAAGEAELRAAYEAEPKRWAAIQAWCSYLFSVQRISEARAILLAQTSDRELGPDAHYQLGRIACLSGADLDDGLEHLKTYLETPPAPDKPTWADAHWRRGLIYEKKGDLKQALAELETALRLEPQHGLAQADLERIKKGKK